MNRRFLATSCLLLLSACTMRPPIYVVTAAPADRLLPLRNARFEIKPIAKVDLHDFKRAFEKHYKSEATFIEGFQKELDATLNESAQAGPYILELPRLDVDSYTEGHWITMGGAPGMPPQQSYQSTEYCVIQLDYRVKDAGGNELLSGTIKESTARGEFLHPNQSKLANAVQGIQKHLVDYLRGRMSPENIGAPQAPAK